MKKAAVLSALVPLLVAGCDSPTDRDEGTVAVRFATSASSLGSSAGASLSGAAQELVIAGTNGTLRIDDIRLIVAEFELERVDGACEAELDDDDCEKFEAGPFLLDLPLTGGAVTVATGDVPAGVYTEFEFEVENLDPDEDDSLQERQAIQSLLATIRGTYPNFPDDASMVVRGSFTPTGGSPQAFTVYFDAEIEVEKELVPPVTVPGVEALTVNVSPALWFRSGGQVIDLAALDGRLVDFELEIEDGFGEVEIDD